MVVRERRFEEDLLDAVKDVEEGGGEEEEVEGVRGGVEGEEAEDISQD